MSETITRALVLASSQIRHLLRVTETTSRHPERDAVILLLGLTCGMRIIEIAQVTVADLMLPSGKLRHEVSLRAAITKGCQQRCVFLSAPKLITAMEGYLAYRVQNRLRMNTDDTRYRGLLPAMPLILTRRGYPYELNKKRRVLETGEQAEYWAADSLQSYVTSLYRAAGIKGGSSHSGRRTFATRLVQKGADIEDVQLLLGHTDLDATRRYVDVDKDVLRRAFADVI